MKNAVVLLLAVAAISCAQDRKAPAKEPDNNSENKRLESVTWDLKSHKLIWVVQKGTERNGEFVPSASDRYEITPDDAVMAFSNERRGFTEEEAASLHKLLDTLSLYCAESVIWWDQGEGTRLNGPGDKGDKGGDKSKEAAPPKRERVDHKPATDDPVRPLLVARTVTP